jgi:hypothetical protein
MIKHLFIFVILLLCSCASIVGHKASSITLDSSPSGATVEVLDNNVQTKFVGVTPTTTSLPNGDAYFTKARYTVKMWKDGYEPNVTNMVPDLNGWYWGNILFGGLIGMLIVDPLTGSMFEFDPAAVHTSLSARQEPATASNASAGPAEEHGGQGPSTADKLEELKRLKDESVLNDQEFEAKKRKLIDQL